MRGELHVDGRLQLSDGKHTIDVTADGSRLQAEIGELVTDRRSLQRAGISVKLARRLSREFDARGLTLVITREGASIAELGAGVRSGPIARLFGFSRLRLSKRR